MKRRLNSTQLIVLSFVLVITVGGLLLMLPIANRSHEWLSPIDALFTSTSAVCVTGLTVFAPVEQLTLFGQLVLIILIQIGGLGLMVLVALLAIFVKRSFSLSEKKVLLEAVNSDDHYSLKNVIKRIVRYTFIFEGIGAIILAIRFIPEFGIVKGIYFGIWHSISAFCNAGFDVIGNQNLIPYGKDWVVMLTISSLIVAAGIGFPVWSDIFHEFGNGIKEKYGIVKMMKHLEVHSKIVLITTGILLVGGTLLVFLFEMGNQSTFASWSIPNQFLGSYFQSVTTRTAGFSGITQVALTENSKFISVILMFIGGSPAGTAGGVKTITVAILLLSVINTIRGHEKVTVFKKTISKETIFKAMTFFALGLAVLVVATVLLGIVEHANPNQSFMAHLYEVASALGTVGLSLDYSATMSVAGKILIMLVMLAGRVGPISLFSSIAMDQGGNKVDKVEYAKANLIVG